MTTSQHISAALCMVAGIAAATPPSADEMKIDLSAPDAAGSWAFLDDRAQIRDGELVLDGRQEIKSVFLEPFAWQDVRLQARFMVEPAEQGVLACGFITRARDAETYYYVHYDRGQAILVRSDPNASWNEIRRVGNLDKPAGRWHEGILECSGDTLKIFLNGRLLYEAKDGRLKAGRIGFYASQGIAHIKDITVTGSPAKPEGTLPPPPRRFVHVCRDAGAGGYEAFPDVCRLSDGRLMCVFYAGYAHVSAPDERHPRGGRIVCCTSADEGATWSEPRTLYDGPDDDRDPSICQLSDGRLLCTFFTLSWPRPGGPYTCQGSRLTISNDHGGSWSEPTLIARDYFCSSPVRQLSDGRLMLGLYAQRPEGYWGAVTWSTDGGTTWKPPVEIDNAGLPLAAETDIVGLRDGNLYAAMRAESGSAAWSLSVDRGASWSVAQPLGFPGHCPYLHRAVDDTILLAQRLPATTLRYSRDECRTWSEPIEVDSVIGAYPSLVTLRDGSVLIVYYEEGVGSDIRARRFCVQQRGLKWLPPADEVLARCGMRLQHVSRIWDAAPHCAFTDLLRRGGKLFCVFREAATHGVTPTSAIRVLCSEDDGRTWTACARIASAIDDLRDPKITLTPDNRLMVYAAAAHRQPVEGVTHRNFVWFSGDGQTWSQRIEIGEPNVWLWRITWNEGTAYGVGYSVTRDRFVRLYRSVDGVRYAAVAPDMGISGYANETSTLCFQADGTARVLLRRDPEMGALGTARPPYRDWTWQPLDQRVGGPEMAELPGGFLAAVRLYDPPVRTGLVWVDPQKGTTTEFMTLPSGGDTSYAGMAREKNHLWISYYSSHEGKTSIYLAHLRIDDAD